MDHVSIKSAFVGLEKYFIRGFFVYFTLMNKHSVGYRVFTILTISLIFTFLLSMGVVSQVMAAAPDAAPTNITQCKPATANTITLCWTAAGVPDGSPVIVAYYITNSTETCSGEGAGRGCSFGGYSAALTTDTVANFLGGTNATGGTGSGATIANFTNLSPGILYKFIIKGQSDH